LVGDIRAEVGKDNVLKLSVSNEILRENSNDNGVPVANFAISKILIIKSTIVLCPNSHKFT
jgi:hypothetical protein